MKKYFFTCFLIFFIFCLQASAQQDSVSLFYQKTKKNTTLINASNILSTDVISIIGGEFPVLWDHKFSKYFETELGLGLILPYYVNLNPFSDVWLSDDDEKVPFSNDKFGYSLFAGFHNYFFPSPSGSFYSGLFFHYKHYSVADIFECGIQAGWQRLFLEHFMFDLGMRFSFFSQNSDDDMNYFYSPDIFPVGFNLAFSLKLGYILN